MQTHAADHPYRWRIALLLGFGVLVNYFDRVNLSVSHAALHDRFAMSDITFGYLSGAYNWTYAVCQIPVGYLLDRFGVRRVSRISILLWSIASFWGGLARSTASLFGARYLLGVGEAPTFPANAKAVGLWFPEHERGLATAVSDAAAKFASAIGVPLFGLVLLRLGWRWSFVTSGLISLIYLALFSRVYRDPEWLSDATFDAAAHTTPEGTLRPEASIPYLMTNRKVFGLCLGFGSYNYVFYLLVTWLPTYLSTALGIDLLHSFLYTGVPWLVATCTDLASGFGVDYLIQRGWNANRVRRTVLLLGMTCGLGILGAVHAHTPGAALFWISVSIGGLSAAAPIAWSVPSLIAPRNSTGKVGGIVNGFSQISGISAPILTGYAVHRMHSFAGAFAIASAYLVVGILGYIFLLGNIHRIPEEA